MFFYMFNTINIQNTLKRVHRSFNIFFDFLFVRLRIRTFARQIDFVRASQNNDIPRQCQMHARQHEPIAHKDRQTHSEPSSTSLSALSSKEHAFKVNNTHAQYTQTHTISIARTSRVQYSLSTDTQSDRGCVNWCASLAFSLPLWKHGKITNTRIEASACCNAAAFREDNPEPKPLRVQTGFAARATH